MKKRLIIPIEFSKYRYEEVELFVILKNFSNSSGTIKDILKKNIPLEVLNRELTEIEKEEIKKLMED